MAASAKRKRSGSSIEAAMQKLRADAIKLTEAEFPKAEEILVSFFDNDVIVDFKDADGLAHRYAFLPEDNTVALEKALASGRIKVVTYVQPDD